LVLKNFVDIFLVVAYYWDLNGYSLIPSWWRDRPNETQQPAVEEIPVKGEFSLSEGANLKQGNSP
jgi:hypothetical protein